MKATEEMIDIYKTLQKSGLPDSGIFAIMGNMYVESGLRANNMQNSYEKRLGYTDSTYTSAVDNGSYTIDSFSHDSCGYGLCQWTYWSRKQALAEYAKVTGKSIGDSIMQADFCIRELQTSYKPVWNTLASPKNDLYTNVKYFCVNYERPANQSEMAIMNRYNKAGEVRTAVKEYLDGQTEEEVYLLPKKDYDTIMAILGRIKV